MEACIANVYAGFLWMLLEAPRLRGKRPAISAAAEDPRRRRDASRAAQRRVAARLGGRRRARRPARCPRIAEEFPRDLVIVKLQQYLEFNRGNSPAMLRVALKVIDRNADIPYIHGMAAFAYEQCHLLGEAERAARTALELKPKEPWAQHALAHVMLTHGRIEEGAQFLEGDRLHLDGAQLVHGHAFMVAHGTVQSEPGPLRQALEIYDRHCWGVAKDYSQDQVGAVSLLARLEIAGVDVGSRWQELAGHLVARADDTVQPFFTLQYLYGLARAQRPEAHVCSKP